MATATAKPSETLTVELPVCPDPDCRRVGKIPMGYYGGKEYCAGPEGKRHKKLRMKKAAFRLVEEGEQ